MFVESFGDLTECLFRLCAADLSRFIFISYLHVVGLFRGRQRKVTLKICQNDKITNFIGHFLWTCFNNNVNIIRTLLCECCFFFPFHLIQLNINTSSDYWPGLIYYYDYYFFVVCLMHFFSLLVDCVDHLIAPCSKCSTMFLWLFFFYYSHFWSSQSPFVSEPQNEPRTKLSKLYNKVITSHLPEQNKELS